MREPFPRVVVLRLYVRDGIITVELGGGGRRENKKKKKKLKKKKKKK